MKKKIRRYKVSILGRTVPLIALAVALSAAVGFALLTNFVAVTGQATVEQSVVLDSEFDGGCHLTWVGQEVDQCTDETETSASWSAEAFGGQTRSVGIRLVNRGDSGAPIEFALDATIPSLDGAVWGTDITAELFDDYDPVDEDCDGASLGSFDSEESSVDGGILDGGESKWYCINLDWNIAAVPGDYDFSADINPV